MLGFSYTMFFTRALDTGTCFQLSDAILAKIFMPQLLAGAAMLPQKCSIWLAIPLILIAATMVSLIEARLLLGLANLVGKIEPIAWLGHQNSKSPPS